MPNSNPASDSPKHGSRHQFEPAELDRRVISPPLLAMILEEKSLIESVKEEDRNGFNSAILLQDRYSVESKETRSAVEKVVYEAVDAMVRQAAPERKDYWEALGKRHYVGKRVSGANALFAWIDERVIRRIMARQARLLRNTAPLPVIIEKILPSRFQVIIDLNLDFIGGREAARDWVKAAVAVAMETKRVDDDGQRIHTEKNHDSSQYIFATLQADVIAELVDMDAAEVTMEELERELKSEPQQFKGAQGLRAVKADIFARLIKEVPLRKISVEKRRAIHHIWPDFVIRASITKSISTVKANAAINSFAAYGTDIVWAVMDTGVQGNHPHFYQHRNILAPALGLHRNFTTDESGPLIDANGHGTHVAGIIAGQWLAPKSAEGGKALALKAVSRCQDAHGDTQQEVVEIKAISGMAPECKLVSLKVLDENGDGNASNLIAAIAHVQEINGNGRRLRIHGVNISAGYEFDPKWFACGQSPLCVEVDRLVKSGVVVVVAAGNTGYGAVNNDKANAGLTVTINDPGNAELAITVGSTHREMPHIYGVSYFSSKGPTGDGRLKPDLVAPGERIISCASSLPAPTPGDKQPPSELKREVAAGEECDYIETSGTSMAAPHVSGVIAAFLSIRREFIGRPDQVKNIFVTTSTDLHRDRYFQGAGLVDLMRAIQSV